MAATCRSCGANIVWVKMIRTGKPNPLDAEVHEKGNVLVIAGTGEARHLGIVITDLDAEAQVAVRNAGAQLRLSHFATCPDREQHRKKETA